MNNNSQKKNNSNLALKVEKKKLDKKKYINLNLNNKVKLQQWEQNRQKTFQRKYNKQFKTNRATPNQQTVEEAGSSKDNGRVGLFQSAQLELKRRKEEKKQLIAERIKKKNEIDEAISKYKQKKAEKFKKLSKKTKRGQPVMKDRLQLLFEEVKQKIANENSEQVL